MTKFTDGDGREWRITLTLGAIDRVLDEVGIDLLKPDAEAEPDKPVWFQILDDERTLAKVLGVVMATDAVGGETDDDRLAGFDGASLTKAAEAFFTEFMRFCRDRGHLNAAAAIEKALVTRQLHQEKAAKQVARISPERLAEKAVRGARETDAFKELADVMEPEPTPETPAPDKPKKSTSASTPGKRPASSGSTPGATRSANSTT